MGDKSDKPSVVTSGELVAVLQAMDEKYRFMFDALSKQGGSSRPDGEIKEDIHPLQMPHVKLEGSETYASWAEHAETILVSRKLEGYILGTVEKPTEEDSKEGQRWKMTNALVRAWLLSSVSPQIAKQVERIKEASEIWRLLKGTFSGVGNEMLACRIQRELQELCQGERSVVEYVSELKRLWSDLDYYDPIDLECGKCIERFSKWTERKRVRDFLNGLNSKFENRRAALYGARKLPSLEQAISAIISEETRLKLEVIGPTTQGVSHRSAAFLASEGVGYQKPGAITSASERKCYEYGQPVHMQNACPELFGGGRGRGHDWRGRGRGRLPYGRRGGARAQGLRLGGRVNTCAAVEEASHTMKVDMTVDEWERWSQFKGLSLGEKSSAQASTSLTTASANFGGNNSNTLKNKLFDATWLIDSGASRHMAGSYGDFLDYVPDQKKSNVKLADGSWQLTKGSGTIICRPNMALSSVLHVPSFPINLLSVSCTTRELNCAAIFFPTWCLFQELGTGRVLGTGSMRDGLYYLDNNTLHVVAAASTHSPQEDLLIHHHRLGHIPFAILGHAGCETGGDNKGKDDYEASREMIGAMIPTGEVHDGDEGTAEPEQEQEHVDQQGISNEARWPRPNEEHDLQVYKRRKWNEREHQMQGEEHTPLRQDLEAQEQHDTNGTLSSPSVSSQTPLSTSTSDGTPSSTYDDLDIPIAHRKQPRINVGKLPSKLSPYNTSYHVSYSSVDPSYKSFIAALDSTTPIPRDWQEAKKDPKWREAMLEEMAALDKNNTWVLTPIPVGKKIVGCKWVFTVKQTPEERVERYKARLVAKGYSQTYGVDYDETFAPVAKMNTVRTLISVASNLKWDLFQMDVKNAFLRGDLQEEVYMDIPPGFSSSETEGKVCKLKKSLYEKSLYGLKQSPRAWFGRFRKEICSLGYQQSNADHTLFFRIHNDKIDMLVVYVDDIVITGNDDEEIQRLKKTLARIFEVKDLGSLHYFLGIEVAYGAQGIYLSQRKYVLDLLTETGMIGCKPAATPVEQNHHILSDSGDPVDKYQYQSLVIWMP
ncbi:uncharacterized protein [Lolium perenne]|uniref:uncharacterized protein n=1 Tax=Lolium perenne TaxID=4522 RepID=UPI003A98DC02